MGQRPSLHCNRCQSFHRLAQARRLWDMRHQRCVQSLPLHADSVWSLLVSDDFSTIYSGGRDRRVYRTQLDQGGSDLLLVEQQPIHSMVRGICHVPGFVPNAVLLVVPLVGLGCDWACPSIKTWVYGRGSRVRQHMRINMPAAGVRIHHVKLHIVANTHAAEPPPPCRRSIRSTALFGWPPLAPASTSGPLGPQRQARPPAARSSGPPAAVRCTAWPRSRPPSSRKRLRRNWPCSTSLRWRAYQACPVRRSAACFRLHPGLPVHLQGGRSARS